MIASLAVARRVDAGAPAPENDVDQALEAYTSRICLLVVNTAGLLRLLSRRALDIGRLDELRAVADALW